MKQLLAILGSPHTKGSAAAMLSCVTTAAIKAGWNVNLVHLYDKNITFCSGCRTCITTGNCIYEDDLQEISKLLKNCDIVALAAPTYWANVPAVVKNLFDRLLETALEEAKPFPKPKLSSKQKYLLLTACNTPFPFCWLPNQGRGAILAMDNFFKASGMRCLGKVIYANANGHNSLPKSVAKKIRRYWA